MAKCSFLLGLITGLLALLPCTIAEDIAITDIFTVQGGARDGGCDGREAVLDQWLSEGLESLDVALKALDEYNQRIEVRRSMDIIFGFRNQGPLRGEDRIATVERIKRYIEIVYDFYSHRAINGQPFFNRASYWLFCDSTFLSLHEPTSPASDFQGNDILDQNGNPVRIVDVPKYREMLAEDADNKSWWSGELTDLNGYYFTEYGGNFCYTNKDLAITAAIQPFQRGANGEAENYQEIASVIMCPYSFDGSPRPNSYRVANDLIASGTNLADAVPKSASLLHELFHALHGIDFLSGEDEDYDIATCLNLALRNPAAAQANPENYIFFIAHMFHKYGTPDNNEPWSIQTQWDFHLTGVGGNRVMAAF
ncbi:hypothetical protein B0O99DRAFT_154103 [Bisporella sp. PMI_857]|nr:hypothetical protein B0O99DRAFT_154103 [Bisporella sp. PMI_857]